MKKFKLKNSFENSIKYIVYYQTSMSFNESFSNLMSFEIRNLIGRLIINRDFVGGSIEGLIFDYITDSIERSVYDEL